MALAEDTCDKSVVATTDVRGKAHGRGECAVLQSRYGVGRGLGLLRKGDELKRQLAPATLCVRKGAGQSRELERRSRANPAETEVNA